MKMQDKVAVVTGGGSGFGKGIAAELVRRGAKVFITGRDAARLDRAAAEIGATALAADVTSAAEEIGRLVGDLLETPDHLAVPVVTLQPMIQEICPM